MVTSDLSPSLTALLSFYACASYPTLFHSYFTSPSHSTEWQELTQEWVVGVAGVALGLA